MLSLVASLISVGLAGAMSSVPVSITILILLSPAPRRGALPFLCTSLAGSVLLVGLSAAGLHFLPARPSLDSISFPAFLGILAGTALIIYAAYLFRKKTPANTIKPSRLKARFESARSWEFAALGLGLNLRPKALLLAVTAGALIGVRDLTPVEGTALVLAYAVVVQSAVVVPILIWLRSPERAQGQLLTLHDWMQRNGRYITAVAALVIGVFLMAWNLLQL